MQITTIGLDLAKHWFQVHGVDATGHIVVRRRLWRSGVIAYFGSLEPCLVGMEACATAHHWARELTDELRNTASARRRERQINQGPAKIGRLCIKNWRLHMGNLWSAITTLLLGGVGWIGFNFFGKPIVTLRDNRRDALQVAERYGYVGLHGSPSEALQLTALAALHDAGNVLRAHVRERSGATRIYCRVLHYDLEKAASALFGLGEAVRGQYAIGERARRLMLHALFVALGSTDHLTVDEVAVARAEMGKWHDGNRNLTVHDQKYMVVDTGVLDLKVGRKPPPDIV